MQLAYFPCFTAHFSNFLLLGIYYKPISPPVLVLGAVLESVGIVPSRFADWAGVDPQHWAQHLPGQAPGDVAAVPGLVLAVVLAEPAQKVGQKKNLQYSSSSRDTVLTVLTWHRQ